MNEKQRRVAALCDGTATSQQIAQATGLTQKYVQKTMLAFDLPRRARGSAFGSLNGSFSGGRRIDRDGYALVSAPAGHPNARQRAQRNTGMILEHRLIVETLIGRALLPTETVDHIDGLRLHNAPSNLRLFEKNAKHLQATISGQRPKWSAAGLAKMSVAPGLRACLERVDMYATMKKNGDARLREILRAMLQLGPNSPYLWGTSRHLAKAGIVDLSRSSLERELDLISRKYA